MRTIITKIPNHRTFIRGRFTMEIGYPWLAYGAIIALEQIVEKSYSILEFGSGGSTVFFANRAKDVRSIETSPIWYDKVKAVMDEKHPNVSLSLNTMDTIRQFLTNEPDGKYDLILVDSDPLQTNRLEIATLAAAKLKSRGWVVLDNYGKRKLYKFYPAGWELFTFDTFNYSGNGTRILRKP